MALNGDYTYLSITDDNECLTLNGGCDYICNNTEGSHICTCPQGLQISANGRGCVGK